MASFSPLDSYKARSRGLMPTGIVIDKSCRVYVTQIPLERIERDGANAMKAEFEVYGPLESYKMFTDRSGRFVGSALCTYRNPADASMAIYCMDGVEVESSTLHVEPAKEHGVVLLSGSSGNSSNNRDHSRGFLRDTRWQSARGGRGGDGARWLNAGGAGDGEGTKANGTDGSATSFPHGESMDNEQAEGPVSGDGFGASASEEEGKWSHDKYELIAEGRDMDEVLGIRRPMRGGARGRGGGRGGGMAGQRSGDRVAMAFERYIHERDVAVEDKSLPPPPAYTDAVAETPTDANTAVASAAENVETMGEIAFGEDEPTTTVTGKEFGALPGEAKEEA
ncbi:hypothetical protein ABB37_00901 [Leptomonas pyrrhocoris]|uniref:RRM domain-containing protein n=1 Tax=Leptomonas pyrrhocoris TaxID=157538 RepID=A0A0N0E0U4_LEPPY|nr:hypothetical protein ABB37_00901 [Leptomonas pyrrhocoris]KPA86852.1 hypothetical protein ABB37_00901 [Leptomonas pyrrhocoris]|eukprot:XP_015665291.1 hypothetical protein ABB37_00901 [Leptomonas pyrrhocoris]